MSPTPQIAKLIAIRPSNTLSTILPSQFDVAFFIPRSMRNPYRRQGKRSNRHLARQSPLCYPQTGAGTE